MSWTGDPIHVVAVAWLTKVAERSMQIAAEHNAVAEVCSKVPEAH